MRTSFWLPPEMPGYTGVLLEMPKTFAGGTGDRTGPSGRHSAAQTKTLTARSTPRLSVGRCRHLLGVDHQLELARLHDRQIFWLCALEDATGIDAHLTRRIRQARLKASVHIHGDPIGARQRRHRPARRNRPRSTRRMGEK